MVPLTRSGLLETVDAPGLSASPEQCAAELVAIEALAAVIGVRLAPAKLKLGQRFALIDGFHAGPPPILAEVFAHQGPLKSGQKHKVMSDAFKLLAVSKGLPGPRLMLVLTDEAAAKGVRTGWRDAALKALGVEVVTVRLPDEIAAGVRAAQIRQRMVNELLETKADDGGEG